MTTILEVNRVVQTFRVGFWLKRAEILHGVSLKVPAGSVFGFLGANGAGKTTLIHLIVGLRRPISGSIKLNGIDTFSAEARAQLGYLPERPYFHDHLTGEGLLYYFGRLSGLTDQEIQSRIPSVLQEVNMAHALKTELRRYSKGMLQRMGIAQAILHNPKFLVLDEPMSGLDPLGRKEIRELIVRLAEEGRTVFFSSHIISDVEAICDQVALIKKGNIVGCGSISDLIGSKIDRFEVAFRGMEMPQAQGFSGLSEVRKLPEELRGFIDIKVGVNQVVSELIRSGAQIVSLNPVRPSLEDFFL